MQKRYENKYFSIMGDSISTFEGCLPTDFPTFYSYRGAMLTDIRGPEDTWWGQVLRYFGGRLLVNNSWSGSYVCKDPRCEIESYGCSDRRAFGLDADSVLPDCILILIGTNDRGAGFPLTSEDKSDLAVIENAYAAMLEKIKNGYPQADIFCCTLPVTACTRNQYYSFPKKYNGVPTREYNALISRVAEAKDCYVIELWDELQPCDTVDGLHPNAAGMKMIAAKVIEAMEKQNFVKRGERL